ncbi:hypothetical protein DFJ73DRAFT_965036 [Zopfochytrium polystomum]|nr:hypothetical protein DFJ73DRAFT_965036 [Zopfochytrium polystomum]
MAPPTPSGAAAGCGGDFSRTTAPSRSCPCRRRCGGGRRGHMPFTTSPIRTQLHLLFLVFAVVLVLVVFPHLPVVLAEPVSNGGGSPKAGEAPSKVKTRAPVSLVSLQALASAPYRAYTQQAGTTQTVGKVKSSEIKREAFSAEVYDAKHGAKDVIYKENYKPFKQTEIDATKAGKINLLVGEKPKDHPGKVKLSGRIVADIKTKQIESGTKAQKFDPIDWGYAKKAPNRKKEQSAMENSAGIVTICNNHGFLFRASGSLDRRAGACANNSPKAASSASKGATPSGTSGASGPVGGSKGGNSGGSTKSTAPPSKPAVARAAEKKGRGAGKKRVEIGYAATGTLVIETPSDDRSLFRLRRQQRRKSSLLAFLAAIAAHPLLQRIPTQDDPGDIAAFPVRVEIHCPAADAAAADTLRALDDHLPCLNRHHPSRSRPLLFRIAAVECYPALLDHRVADLLLGSPGPALALLTAKQRLVAIPTSDSPEAALLRNALCTGLARAPPTPLVWLQVDATAWDEGLVIALADGLVQAPGIVGLAMALKEEAWGAFVRKAAVDGRCAELKHLAVRLVRPAGGSGDGFIYDDHATMPASEADDVPNAVTNLLQGLRSLLSFRLSIRDVFGMPQPLSDDQMLIILLALERASTDNGSPPSQLQSLAIDGGLSEPNLVRLARLIVSAPQPGLRELALPAAVASQRALATLLDAAANSHLDFLRITVRYTNEAPTPALAEALRGSHLTLLDASACNGAAAWEWTHPNVVAALADNPLLQIRPRPSSPPPTHLPRSSAPPLPALAAARDAAARLLLRIARTLLCNPRPRQADGLVVRTTAARVPTVARLVFDAILRDACALRPRDAAAVLGALADRRSIGRIAADRDATQPFWTRRDAAGKEWMPLERRLVWRCAAFLVGAGA